MSLQNNNILKQFRMDQYNNVFIFFHLLDAKALFKDYKLSSHFHFGVCCILYES